MDKDKPCRHLWYTNVDGVQCCMYCGALPKDKPPLLSDEIDNIHQDTTIKCRGKPAPYAFIEAGMVAQREADVEFYGGNDDVKV